MLIDGTIDRKARGLSKDLIATLGNLFPTLSFLLVLRFMDDEKKILFCVMFQKIHILRLIPFFLH